MSERQQRPRRRSRAANNIDQSIASPCIMICTLDETTELCEGCHRSMDEIREWMIMSREQKLAVLDRVEQRKQSQS